MSEEVINDINSNGSDVQKNCTDKMDSDIKVSKKDQSFDENIDPTEHNNLSNCNEITSLKTDEQTSEKEHELKRELIRIKAELKASSERENELSTKLQKIDFQTVKVAELEILNEELREQLNDSLKECGCLKRDLENVIQEKKDLQIKVSSSNDENDTNYKLLEEKVKTLETKHADCEKELTVTKDKLYAHDMAAKKAISSLKKELTLRVDQVTKMYEDCLRERDGLTQKVSQLTEEKQEISKMQDAVDKKMLEMAKENEKLQQLVKKIQADYKSCQASLLDQEKEIIEKQKEVDKVQEDINAHVVKVKWAQNKLKSELDAHKETKTKLTQTLQKLKEAKEEGEQIRADCQAMIKQYQESEEMKSISLDQELKQKESELQKRRISSATQDENNKNLSQELNKRKEEVKNLTEEKNNLNAKLKNLDEKVAKYALAISTYEKTVVNQRKEIDNQITKIEELEKLRSLLFNSDESNQKLIMEKLQLTDTVNELQSEMAAVHAKESELLDFMEKMTAKCTQLQSTLSVIQAQNEAMNKENEELKTKCSDLESDNKRLSSSLKSETQAKRVQESELQGKLEEKTKAVQELATSLEDVKNDLKVTKKKNAAHLKDITRQLQQSKRKVDSLEKNSNSKDRLDSDSRTSSSGSLDKADNVTPHSSMNNTHYPPASPPAYGINNGGVSLYNSNDLMSTEVEVKTKSSHNKISNHELDHEKSIMLSKICELQKVHAKKCEKLDFLTEHNNTLVDEIAKKNKIIQNYMMKEDSGQLTSTDYDEKKAKLAKNRGVMSSVYSSKATDSTMTLELSLEINSKLQALLEDTILKNITLKESIETLGDEVARLSTALSVERSEGTNR
ncbi:coiled-coil domain-containing protein 186-like [Dendronephthya gigantea]|uniref:coiled-coil domain-containing protein 186-like n=1 Tax=Dendronephthya gigantea TaxID=151771 RepID=UPI00106CB6B7|nr:coiled-coil domain-containing protein 186-like [Dendronephthya gigantea]